MDIKKLKTVFDENETAKRIGSFVSERKRNTVYTAFSGLRADLKKKDGKEVDRNDFDNTFRKLAEIGAGKLQCSPRGVCQGFLWQIPVREVGLVMKGETSNLIKNEEKLQEIPKERMAGPRTVTLVVIRKGKKPKMVKADAADVERFLHH